MLYITLEAWFRPLIVSKSSYKHRFKNSLSSVWPLFFKKNIFLIFYWHIFIWHWHLISYIFYMTYFLYVKMRLRHLNEIWYTCYNNIIEKSQKFLISNFKMVTQLHFLVVLTTLQILLNSLKNIIEMLNFIVKNNTTKVLNTWFLCDEFYLSNNNNKHTKEIYN